MSHPFLPKRKSGTANRFPDPPTVSVWDERPKNHLESLGEAIDVSSTGHRIHSIPDPWARAILFDRALYNTDHLLHEAIQGEWRGLLAILGLRERRNFTGLSARDVVLDPVHAVSGSFSSVVAQLRPSADNLISAETGWNRFYTLRWHRQPFDRNRPLVFAMTSPTTLVCTGADYQQCLSTAEVPWFIDGILRDPREHLSARERQVLSEWLLLISNRIVALGHKSPRSNWMVRNLRGFAADLNPGLPHRAAETEQETGVSTEDEVLSESSLQMTYGLYRVLDRACRREETALSDVEIAAKTGAPRFVLVDPTLAEQWHENPREITVYKDINLATAGHLTASGKVSDSLGDGVSWCTPDFFFTDRLIYEANPEPSFPGCLPVKTTGTAQRKSVVLPLNPEALQLLTPRDIADRFNLEWLPNGRATCSLKLMLKSSAGKERQCRIQKTYSDQEMVSISNLPLVCLWPDFRVEGLEWKANYTFQLWPSDKEEVTVKPWPDAGGASSNSRKYSIDKQKFQVCRTDAYPEALICETPYFNAGQNRERLARGLLLLQMPELAQPAPPASVVLGVDFGSTGTNLFTRIDEGDPQPLTFGSHVRRITAFDKRRTENICLDLFVPSVDWETAKILSLFYDFGHPPEGDDARIALRDGHVLYVADPRHVGEVDGKRVRANLKWGAERDRIAARDFLMQVCLQAAAEVAVHGARSLDVRFSYPTAFSRRDLNQFQGHWTFVAKKISELTGIRFEVNSGKVDTREAVTATRFFSDYTGHGDRLDITSGALTLDIGGGTTDFAVWNKRALLAHSSVILAGRDILRAPLYRKPQILTEILTQAAVTAPQNGQREAAQAQLDAILSKHGADLINALPIRQARPSVQGLLSIMEVGLCGLTFYAGLLVRRLAEAQKFQQGHHISIFVGGNGSRMFSWCSLGVTLADSEIHDRAAAAFLAGSNLKGLPVELHLSARPKSEVAYGLVSPPLPLDKDSEDYARPLAGEGFKVGENPVEWKESPSAEDILAKRVVVDRSFTLFSQFLQSIERKATADTLDRIGGYVDTRFAEQAREIEEAGRKDPSIKPGDVIRNEPVFVMALKRYLEMEIDAWEKRF